MTEFKMADKDAQPVYIAAESVVALEGKVGARRDQPVTRVYLFGSHWLDVQGSPGEVKAKLSR